MSELRIYKDNPSASLPEYATEYSAEFDLRACLPNDMLVKFWTSDDGYSGGEYVTRNEFTMSPNSRALIPTGLIFDLEPDEVMRIHIRSSMALKHGIFLANSEGVVDADYVDPTYVMLWNSTNQYYRISHNDRIAQASVEKRTEKRFVEVNDRPLQKTSRTGGFGSTGKS